MDNFAKALAFVEVVEGGYSNDPTDTGNWTGGAVGNGELRGTKYGISAAAYPNLDIKALTKDKARALYRRDYWEKIGGDALPWPLSLVAFDHAVNAGVSRARAMLEKTSDPYVYISHRIDDYTTYRTWQHHGRGWVRRMAAILREVATEDSREAPEAGIDSTSFDDGVVGGIRTLVVNTASGPLVIRLPTMVAARWRDDKIDLDVTDLSKVTELLT